MWARIDSVWRGAARVAWLSSSLFGTALGSALVCAAPAVITPSAPTPQWLTADDMAKAVRERPMPSIQLPGRPSSQVDADRATRPAVPSLPAQVPPQGSHLDIEALARSAVRLQQGPEPGAGQGGADMPRPVRIFVTLDMPPQSLRLLAEQAARSGATLVLRGLKNQSMRQTVAAVADVLGLPAQSGTPSPHWLIDPEAFERHRITRAPTFVVDLGAGVAAPPESDACRTSCADPAPTSKSLSAKARDRYVLIAGDVSLAHALNRHLKPVARETLGTHHDHNLFRSGHVLLFL